MNNDSNKKRTTEAPSRGEASCACGEACRKHIHVCDQPWQLCQDPTWPRKSQCAQCRFATSFAEHSNCSACTTVCQAGYPVGNRCRLSPSASLAHEAGAALMIQEASAICSFSSDSVLGISVGPDPSTVIVTAAREGVTVLSTVAQVSGRTCLRFDCALTQRFVSVLQLAVIGSRLGSTHGPGRPGLHERLAEFSAALFELKLLPEGLRPEVACQ